MEMEQELQPGPGVILFMVYVTVCMLCLLTGTSWKLQQDHQRFPIESL